MRTSQACEDTIARIRAKGQWKKSLAATVRKILQNTATPVPLYTEKRGYIAMSTRWMPKEEMHAFLAQHTEGRLATCSEAGEPYITPLNYLFHQGRLYFHSKREGRKLDNLSQNSRVCFEVSEVNKIVVAADRPCACSTRYTSVLAFGSARLIEDDLRKAAILNLLMKRFAGEKPFPPVLEAQAARCAVIEMEIEQISGKRNVDPE
jgi:hypothetical protein